MIDVTKLQTLTRTLPKIVKAIPRGVRQLTEARDAIMKMASPATAAFVSKVAAKNTPFGVHAAVFGSGFALGAITTAFVTPVSGAELRTKVRSEALRWWASVTGEVEDVAESAREDLRDDVSAVGAEVGKRATETERAAEAGIRRGGDQLTDAVEAAAEATREAVVTMPADPLDELTKEELYDRAKAAGIEGRSQMAKDELIDALRKTLN